MIDYAARNLDPLALLAATQGIDTGTGDVPKAYVDQLTWAYLGGMRFVETLRDLAGSWKLVDYALDSRPPATTEQVLHPRKYIDDERPSAVRIDGAPLRADGWRRIDADVFGELPTSQLLELGADRDAARAAAAGWDGDRYELWRRDVAPGDCEYPCRAELVLVAVWAFDTAADATEFDRAASDVPGARPRRAPASVATAGGSTAGTWRSRAASEARPSSSRQPARSPTPRRWRSSGPELGRSRRESLPDAARRLLALRRDDAFPASSRVRGDGARVHPALAARRGRAGAATPRSPAASPCSPRRRAGSARWWLLGVLVAVFPANVHMAADPAAVAKRGVPIDRIPRWLLWARLPIQPLFMLWAWRATTK